MSLINQNLTNDTLTHDGWIYKIRQFETEEAGIRTSFQAYRYNSARDGEYCPSLIDNYWRNLETDPPKYVVGKDIFHFGSLGNSPIMTLWKNRHRWDNLEMVAPTRERLLALMHKHGFPTPWLIFQDHRVFPTFTRMRPEATPSLTTFFTAQIRKRLSKENERDTYLARQVIDGMSKVQGRYIVVEVDNDVSVQDTAFLEAVYDLVNHVFFRHGKVMVCKRVFETTTPYQGVKGDQYFDLKILVDRAAPFSEGKIQHGWDDPSLTSTLYPSK